MSIAIEISEELSPLLEGFGGMPKPLPPMKRFLTKANAKKLGKNRKYLDILTDPTGNTTAEKVRSIIIQHAMNFYNQGPSQAQDYAAQFKDDAALKEFGIEIQFSAGKSAVSS